ncbi:MAG: hypothetical protein Q9212_006694 [Teloschistes hypoglaucus]
MKTDISGQSSSDDWTPAPSSHNAHLATNQASSISTPINHNNDPSLFTIGPGKIGELRKRLGNQVPIFVHKSLHGEKFVGVVKAEGPGSKRSKQLLTLKARPWDATHSFWSVRHRGRDYIAVEQPRIRGRVIYKRLLDLGRMDQLETFTFAYAANEIDSVPRKVDLTSHPKTGASSSQVTQPERLCSSKLTTTLPPRQKPGIFIPNPLAPVRHSGSLSRPHAPEPARSSNPSRQLSATELDDEDEPLSWVRSRVTGNLPVPSFSTTRSESNGPSKRDAHTQKSGMPRSQSDDRPLGHNLPTKGNLQTSNHQAQETPFIITPEAIAELRRRLGTQIPPFVTELFNGRKEGHAVLASPSGRHPRDAKIKQNPCDLTAQQWNEKHYYWTVQHQGCQYIVVRQVIKAGRVAYKRWLGLDATTQLESQAFAYERDQPIQTPVSQHTEPSKQHGPEQTLNILDRTPASKREDSLKRSHIQSPTRSDDGNEPPRMKSRSTARDVSSHRTSGTPSPGSIQLPDRVSSSAQAENSNDVLFTRRSPSANVPQASHTSQAFLRRREERRLEKRQIRQQQMVLLKEQKERQQAEERLYVDRLRELDQEEREDSMMDMS